MNPTAQAQQFRFLDDFLDSLVERFRLYVGEHITAGIATTEQDFERLFCEFAGLRCGLIVGDDANAEQLLNETTCAVREINALLAQSRRPGRQREIKRLAGSLLMRLATHAEQHASKLPMPKLGDEIIVNKGWGAGHDKHAWVTSISCSAIYFDNSGNYVAQRGYGSTWRFADDETRKQRESEVGYNG